MLTISLFDLVCGALPEDFEPSLLKSYGKKTWWRDNPRLACAYALRKCPYLDWRSYLTNYPDVRDSGIDPILHFLNHGLYEGRKLAVADPPAPVPEWRLSIVDLRPKVSVVICNYNNELYVEHAINSLRRQTLKDIEIIVVDDASTDNSLAIIEAQARQDPRIRVIAHDHNQSQHMGRLHGVAAATGQYIMFLDSDDYFVGHACERAYQAVCGKYDFVAFNIIPQFPSNASLQLLRRYDFLVHPPRAREFGGDEIFSALYEGHLFTIVCQKIFEASYCKSAFAQMYDKPLPRTEDDYQMSVLASLAKSAAQIDDRLYVYRLGIGTAVATAQEDSYKRCLTTGESWLKNEEWAQRSGKAEHIEKMKAGYMRSSVVAWFKFATPENCVQWFDTLAAQYGAEDLICFISQTYESQIMDVAAKYQYYRPNFNIRHPVKSVGLYYPSLGRGTNGSVIWHLARLLVNARYNVTVFLQQASENDSRLPQEANVVYLGALPSDLSAHLLAWRVLLCQNTVDVLLHHQFYKAELLWQLMMVRFLRVPVILLMNSGLPTALMRRNYFTLQEQTAMLRCADKVAVLTPHEELFYRSQGVDAQFLPQPAILPQPGFQPPTFGQRQQNILVPMGMGYKAKNICDCLQILKLAQRKMPWLEMTFAGTFIDDDNKNSFYDLAVKLELIPSIKVTGWMDDTVGLMDSSLVLLCTASDDCYALTIGMAQGRGLPVITYDNRIDPAENNPGAIRVPFGDAKAAAGEIVSLLSDQDRWQRLSVLAMAQAIRYSGENYMKKMSAMLEAYDRVCAYKIYSPSVYNNVLKDLAFFGSNSV